MSSSTLSFDSIHAFPTPSYEFLEGISYLSSHELARVVENNKDLDECVNLVWNHMEQVRALEHFRHVTTTIRRLEDEIEQQRKQAEWIFDVMKKKNIVEQLKPIILQKRRERYPNLSTKKSKTPSIPETTTLRRSRRVHDMKMRSPTPQPPPPKHGRLSVRAVQANKVRCGICKRMGHLSIRLSEVLTT